MNGIYHLEKANSKGEVIKLKNHLKDQTSPYLLQHAENPVHWYPWCEEAFAKAKQEKKPIFLSIGYSTCHWCHVMAHESFEDPEVAQELNQHYISIKVDKEERPDIDSVYMSVCLLFTGSGGWPTSIFMTPEQKPFFAGTYFPKTSAYGHMGFLELLRAIYQKWDRDRESLFQSAEEITRQLQENTEQPCEESHLLMKQAFLQFQRSFDADYGGFGNAPKFPMAHNLMFLMEYYQISREQSALAMAEKTLEQMYRGGLFDHIGYGFCRYSTDQYFLVPHFEKMLYDNALLLMAYTQAFALTGKELYQRAAQQTAEYVQREMTAPEGGFYSAQDADSEGVEGRYYVFAYDEIKEVLGEAEGEAFNQSYHITRTGNFEGKNIPNLLFDSSWTMSEKNRQKLYKYRRRRSSLYLDDKVLTAWNGLMIAAFADMYRVFGQESCLVLAERACAFIEEQAGQEGLFVSFRQGKCQGSGFLDDYASFAFGLLQLYRATLKEDYLKKAAHYCRRALELFEDSEKGGYYLYGKENESLIARPKETYDGAIPSGNSVMAYNLVKLWQITGQEEWWPCVERQMTFLAAAAQKYPAGQSFFLLAKLMLENPPEHIVCVLKAEADLTELEAKQREGADILVLRKEAMSYPLLNDRTTLYICRQKSCLPPVNL